MQEFATVGRQTGRGGEARRTMLQVCSQTAAQGVETAALQMFKATLTEGSYTPTWAGDAACCGNATTWQGVACDESGMVVKLCAPLVRTPQSQLPWLLKKRQWQY